MVRVLVLVLGLAFGEIASPTPPSPGVVLDWGAHDLIRYDARLDIDDQGRARSCTFLFWRSSHPDTSAWNDTGKVCERLLVFVATKIFPERSRSVVYHYDQPIFIE